ncbi:hypothetical protein [Pseudarthrobacter sp. H2]|uniref:hypothetical protein n=1 Tax=Pseudarthrobacter sp. H2 TaxID=3418415 RepID=UPI003CED28E3
MTTDGIPARIPGHGSFAVTGAAAMIEVFGGLLHCYQGKGGCRRQGLYFSRTEPRKPLRCLLANPGSAGTGFRETETRDAWNPRSGDDIIVCVGHELAPRLDGAVLDFDI